MLPDSSKQIANSSILQAVSPIPAEPSRIHPNNRHIRTIPVRDAVSLDILLNPDKLASDRVAGCGRAFFFPTPNFETS